MTSVADTPAAPPAVQPAVPPQARALGPAWLLGVRDLQRRRRRFAIGVVASALVLALTILQTGVSASFDNEIARTVDGFGADRWVKADDTLGPFSAAATFPADRVREVRRLPGVTHAEPFAVATALTEDNDMVNMIGVVPGGAGSASGQAPRELERGGAVVDDSLELGVGDTILLNGRDIRVTDTIEGRSFYAGVPTVYVSLDLAQDLALGGRRLATGIAVQGVPRETPSGLATVDEARVTDDLGRTVEQARGTISLVRTLLWIVAAGIIGAVLYMSAVERVRDFAVLKAIGVSTRSLVLGLALQAVLLSLSAVGLGMLLELVIAPASPMNVEVPGSTYLVLPIGAVIVGVLASIAALRRALGTDPALAFGR